MITFACTFAFVLCFIELTYVVAGDCNNGEIQSYAYCSSSEYPSGAQPVYPVAGITGITIITSLTLDQQNNTEACVYGDTYGKFGADRVWVRNGCDAIFIVCGEGSATTTKIASSTPTATQTSTSGRKTSTDLADSSTMQSFSMSNSVPISDSTNGVPTTDATGLTTMTPTAITNAILTAGSTTITKPATDEIPTIVTDGTSTSTNDTTVSALTSCLTSTVATSDASQPSFATLSTGAIAGIASGGFLLVVLICIALVYALKSHNKCNGIAQSEHV